MDTDALLAFVSDHLPEPYRTLFIGYTRLLPRDQLETMVNDVFGAIYALRVNDTQAFSAFLAKYPYMQLYEPLLRRLVERADGVYCSQN